MGLTGASLFVVTSTLQEYIVIDVIFLFHALCEILLRFNHDTISSLYRINLTSSSFLVSTLDFFIKYPFRLKLYPEFLNNRGK